MDKKIYILPQNGSSQPEVNYGKALLSQNGYWTLKDMGRVVSDKYLKDAIKESKGKNAPSEKAG